MKYRLVIFVKVFIVCFLVNLLIAAGFIGFNWNATLYIGLITIVNMCGLLAFQEKKQKEA